MGVIDKVTDRLATLLPVTRERERERPDLPPVGAEVLALRDNLDRWLQRFLEDPWGLPSAGEFQLVPAVNVRETDKEVVVTAEVPGLEKADLELTITGDRLLICGEKREDEEHQRGDFQVSERRYGRFVRTVPLPDHVDVDRAEARVDRGVLMVRFPKRETGRRGRRVPIAS